jgi:hypothetical protein
MQDGNDVNFFAKCERGVEVKCIQCMQKLSSSTKMNEVTFGDCLKVAK